MAEATSFPTTDGETLEGELHLPPSARAVVVITHPHPTMGGDMHTPVPNGFFRAVEQSDLEAAALRFNFRGVGRSTGTHDNGVAEQLDVIAAISHAGDALPGVPIILAGWSFGADISLTVGDDRVVGWFLAAPPLRVVDPSAMAAQHSPAPKVLAIGAHDQFISPDDALETTAGWQNTTIDVVDGADHFFGPTLPDLVSRFVAFVNATTQATD